MISGERVVAVIPARGGSKSIPKKNIKLLGGKPLIAWSIEVAKKTKEIDRIIVSTDDVEIAEVAEQYGAEIAWRPEHLAQDNSLVIDTIRDMIVKLKEDKETAKYMVLLEPTSPLRESTDVSQCIELLIASQTHYDSVATFKEADLNPYRAWKLENAEVKTFIEGAIPWMPRQQLPKAYQLNGAVYAFAIGSITNDTVSILNGKQGAIIMPKERSVDIDEAIDFDLVETILKKRVDSFGKRL